MANETEREWSPGDVAAVTTTSGVTRRLMRLGDGPGEQWVDTDGCGWTASEIHHVRPLVAIDPTEHFANDDQLRNLLYLLRNHGWDELAAEFAPPEPERPEEPTGLGAVVEASAYTDALRRFVRCSSPQSPWTDESGNGHEWAELLDVRVLSKGLA